MDTQQQNPSQQPASSQFQTDLVSLWEQMGACTGSLIGKFIGLNAQLGLTALQSLQTAIPVTKPGIRTQVWTEMGRNYGESLGYTIGLAMDGFMQSVDATVVKPLDQTVRGKNNDS